MKTLLTGFEPFLDNSVNPSEELIKDSDFIDAATIVLPVSYKNAKKLLEEKIKDTKPSLIISFGLASQRKKISLEERAYNLMGAKCVDEDGIMLNGKKIIDGGNEILSTNLQLASLSSALQNEGFDVEVSHDAGRFICNEVYYLSLKNVKTALFVHLPPLKYSSKENNVSFLKALLKLLDV